VSARARVAPHEVVALRAISGALSTTVDEGATYSGPSPTLGVGRTGHRELYVRGIQLAASLPDVAKVKSWDTLFALWQQHQIAAPYPPTTIGLRLYHIGRLAKAFPAGPQTVTLELLKEWLASFDWAPQTRRSMNSSLRAFWDWLIETGRATDSPPHRLPRVRVPRPKPRPAPEADFRFALSISDRRTRLAIMLAGYCGLRRGEIARARREDMEPDLVGHALRVIGKGGHVRLVPLPDPIVVEIRKVESGWLFPSSRPQDNGRHISAHWLGKLVTRNLPRDLTTHTLRHRCATVAYAGSKDLRAVQELLGHSKPEITAMYTAVSDNDVRAAMMHAVAS
jgi:integrase/recombinase XerC